MNLFPHRRPEPDPVPDSRATFGEGAVSGDYVQLDGERCYRIANCHRMPDFFMTLASSSDHWMFLSSRGAVTAGRKNSKRNLFPYYSADKIIDTASCTGPRTIIRCRDWDGITQHWEPFASSESLAGPLHMSTRRNIYKNGLGNKVYLEEINDSLGLCFRYRWTFGMDFGFVRTCWLTNLSATHRTIELLDGLQNLMPCGLEPDFQLRYSNLGDAYKKNELLSDSQLGLYYLSSIPTDRAEPSEGLRATVAWQSGLDRPTILLSDRQLDAFRAGNDVAQEVDVRACRGAYFVGTKVHLDDSETLRWNITSDVHQDQTDVINLEKRIVESPLVGRDLQDDIERCQDGLMSIVSASDGRQLGSDELSVQRHQSNTLFNVMRGGYPSGGYKIHPAAFACHVYTMSREVYQRHRDFIESLQDGILVGQLNEQIEALGDADLIRIGLEYLPLTFGRRHGDPTRPWNAFSIDIRNSDGSTKLSYQGNWRDIFQNWEALSLAFPMFAENMVFRFVNASTADGYNPYRITSEGIEWECPEPGNPWSNIGYWGDHQIVYLLRLLQSSLRFNPDGLNRSLNRECCVYAEIPYRIRPYDSIREDPRHTIDFDRDLDEAIDERVSRVGADGKLLRNSDDELCHATLGEKLLVPMLAKMTNFVPDGGIWLNTQRPEWNDANNAIVGNGLSMVTVYYLRSYFTFLTEWFTSGNVPSTIGVSSEIAELLQRVAGALGPYVDADETDKNSAPTERLRRQVVDALATAGSNYRDRLYREGLSGLKVQLPVHQCVDALEVCLKAIDRSIMNNRRPDGLYESYNLLSFGDDDVRIEPLYEMLEGQVAVLSSGLLSPAEAVQVLDALRSSKLYRKDQQSYMLYPDRQLPRFIEKNRLSPGDVYQSELLSALIAEGDTTVVRMDDRGDAHFSGDFRNRNDLNARLDDLEHVDAYGDIVRRDRERINDLFERTFHHRKFTGRSGTFFGYEGLGSIYWHMVSKLALATIENLQSAVGHGDDQIVSRLRGHYDEIRSGIGLSKTPAEYGAFPSDPYSHTPAHAGVQQPGMTGQVKEDILCRFIEIGVRIDDGIMHFDPVLFQSSELLRDAAEFTYFDRTDRPVSLLLSAGSFAFTICQTPIIYRRSDANRIVIHRGDDCTTRDGSLALTREETKSLFARDGEVTKIEIHFPKER